FFESVTATWQIKQMHLERNTDYKSLHFISNLHTLRKGRQIMASRTTKGRAVATSSTGPVKANAPSPPRVSGESDNPAQTPVTAVSPSQIMAFKDELVAALRADFASIFKDEIRVVFESEISAIKQEMQDAKTEISNFKTDIRKDVEAMENTMEQMERGLSGCSDDVVALQRTVQQLSNQVAALEDKCEDLEGRSRRNNIRIIGIKDESGSVCIDHSAINSRFMRYYCNLYTSESLKDEHLINSFFQGIEVPRIDLSTKAELESPFTIREIEDAIRSMQGGKSPGPDGYSAEFFKKFSNQLAPLLTAVYNDSLSVGLMPETMRQATISLIHKKGKDKQECGSYRPISLLNVDNKIFAKMIARRLETVLPIIISPDQTGFIKNRYSTFNIRQLYNIIYNPSPLDKPEVVISLDAEKAFDRVEWDYLFYTLEAFGFGPNIISWIKILYKSPMAAVQTNNNISPYFALSRGTRQGSPLSPLLFAIVIEPLAIALRTNKDIKGIARAEGEHKVSLYADDMILYLSDASTSLPVVLNILSDFGKISGYRVNTQKSELMPINLAARESSFVYTLPFKVCMEKIKYLGVWVTHKFKELFSANFPPLLSFLKEDLDRWDLLPLSLAGRINAIKMSVLPKFLYMFQCIPISSFIWNKKNPRIRTSILQRPCEQGGMGLPNIQLYYWAANIKMISYWMEQSETVSAPDWLKLERGSCENTSLCALLYSSLPCSEPVTKYTSNPVVIHSLKIWKQFSKSFKINKFSININVTIGINKYVLLELLNFIGKAQMPCTQILGIFMYFIY
uniref:Reverse transcriptase domain-containing protein n=1 Tax=Pygocentrus nattereri TaxID=42514 RepID=A0A3B4C811_PYGNA